MSDIIEATQKQDPGSELITLYTLELESGFAHFYSGGFTNEDATTRVQFRDATSPYAIQNYDVLPMETEGFEISSDGAYSRPLATIANVSSVFSTAIDGIDYEELIGKKLTRRTTLKQFLYPTSNAQPPIEYPKMVYIIDRIKDRNILTVTFELANPYDLQGVALPRRQIIGGSCPWKYQGASPHLDEADKVGGCDWDKFSRYYKPVDGSQGTIYLNKEDEWVQPYASIVNGSDFLGAFVAGTTTAAVGKYYSTSVTKTRIESNGSHTEESVLDYWEAKAITTTTPSDTNLAYRRLRLFKPHSTSTTYKAYTDTSYNEYVTFTRTSPSPADPAPQLWKVKTLTQTGSAHNSLPMGNNYWTIGDRCAKNIFSCQRRFGGVVRTSDNTNEIDPDRTQTLPFGAFPGSRQFR